MPKPNDNNIRERIPLSTYTEIAEESTNDSIVESINEILFDEVSKKGLRSLLEYLNEVLPKEEFLKSLSILSSNTFSKDKNEEGFPFMPLTLQEEKIILLLAQGKRNNQIATELFISNHTVRTHRNNIHRKLKICGKGINPVIFYEKYVKYITKES